MLSRMAHWSFPHEICTPSAVDWTSEMLHRGDVNFKRSSSTNKSFWKSHSPVEDLRLIFNRMCIGYMSPQRYFMLNVGFSLPSNICHIILYGSQRIACSKQYLTIEHWADALKKPHTLPFGRFTVDRPHREYTFRVEWPHWPFLMKYARPLR